ncbi:MAG: hypothetical protein HOY76_05050, partial [Streptomyces sp.]|nr:hypothetical protein [Streptomyces sp.]
MRTEARGPAVRTAVRGPAVRAVLRWTAICVGLALVLAAGACVASYRRFSANITTDRAAERVLSADAALRPPALVPRARNVLVLAAGEAGPGGDAAVLLHVSADR